MADTAEAANVKLALRIATAATLCLAVSEWLQLSQPSLSVFTCHLAMVMFPYSAFQKALERLVGRLIGVGYGLALILFCRDAPVLLLAMMLPGQLIFFYTYSSGRLSYAALMGGLFLGVIVEIGIATSAVAAQEYAVSMAEQLVLATAATVLVNWLTGAERTTAIETKGPPLVPLNIVWISKSWMVSVGQLGALFVAVWLDLPALPTMISATLLALTTSNAAAMGEKGLERTLGAILGGIYAALTMVLVTYLPAVPLLLAMVFYGLFLAAYFTKASTHFSYTFMQMGLVIPLVLIGPAGGIGSPNATLDRVVGVAVGLTIAEVVFLCWPWPVTVPPAPTPAAPPASAEVVQHGG